MLSCIALLQQEFVLTMETQRCGRFIWTCNLQNNTVPIDE